MRAHAYGRSELSALVHTCLSLSSFLTERRQDRGECVFVSCYQAMVIGLKEGKIFLVWAAGI